MKKKRFISLVLVSSTIFTLLALSSCAKKSSITSSDTQIDITESTTAAETKPVDALEARKLISDDLPERNFKGTDFRISVTDKYAYEMDVETETGDVCDDSVYNRNRSIEDRFNIVIKNVVTEMAATDSADAHVGFIQKSIMAGDCDFELAGLYVWRAGAPILNGLYKNWYDVPYINFDKPWWVHRALEAFTIGEKMYVAVGDLSITTLIMSYAFLFNKDLANNYKIDNLYETVSDGKWTIDYMIKTIADIYSDLDGNGKANKKDLYGFIGDNVTSLDAYLPAFDQPLVKRGDDGYPVICINCEKTVSALEKIYKLYYETPGTFIETVYDDKAIDFKNNQSLLTPVRMYEVYGRLRDMETDYGIIPFPKWDEAQTNYLTNTLDNYSVLGIPITAPNLEYIGIITEALNAESYKSVMPAYFDVALKVKFTRDESSVEMLNIIMDGRTYDFSILHGNELEQLPYIFRNLIMGKKSDFASKYASVETKMQANMKALIDSYISIE